MHDLELQLTDSISRPTSGFPISNSISQCGKHAFMLYQITEASISDVMAEYFDIVNKKLVSVSVLHPDLIDANNFSCDDGHANSSFTRFTVVDDDQGGAGVGATGNIRVRVFDKNFNLIVSRFDIPFAVGTAQITYPVVGGTFSDNDKYIQLTYLTDATSGNQKSRLHILDANTLTDVAMIDFDGSTFGANFIQLKNKTYVALARQNGDFQYGFNTVMDSTESKLLVYRLKNQLLTLVAHKKLPQIIATSGVTVNNLYSNGCVLLGASTRRAVKTTSIFNDDSNNESFGCKGEELRVYIFDGHNLKLVKSKNTDTTTSGPVFYPNKNIILVNQQLSDGNPSFFNLYELTNYLSIKNGTFGAPPFAVSNFSDNGKWLLVTGSDQDVNLNNLNLYHIELDN